MNPEPQLMGLPMLLDDAGQPPGTDYKFFVGRSGVSHRLPEFRDGEPHTRLQIRLSGVLSGAGQGGGWASIAAPVTPFEQLTGPVMVWRGRDAAARDQDTLETRALLAALSGLPRAQPAVVSLRRHIGGTGADMKDRLKAWRNAGWIGERWTKIPNVDLWRQIDHHAGLLPVSWWTTLGQMPDAWQEIAEALARRVACLPA